MPTTLFALQQHLEPPATTVVSLAVAPPPLVPNDWATDSHLPSFPYPSDPDTGGDAPSQDEDALALVLPLLILLTTLLFLLLVFLLFLLLLRRSKRGVYLREEGGPTNLDHEDEFEGEGGLEGIEQRWLEGLDEATRTGYLRAKVWQSQYPPNSQPTDITLSQFLSIQEKGVSAWSFEPDYESNPALIVQSRTEITFLSDGVGMTPEEGGGCCVQSNLPLPRLNEVYYWECKMYEKPEGTTVAIGLATKPFPSFRLPGWSKYSVGYFSSDGFKSHSYPFTSQSYGPPLTEGDVLGVGYRPRTGTVFFTRNGKKLEDAYIGLNRHNLFPTVGANAACTVHVNLGQAGFVFIEANVKKWGLAPTMGTLAPPPAYGSERGSILLESAGGSSAPAQPPPGDAARRLTGQHRPMGGSSGRRRRDHPHHLPPPTSTSPAGAVSALSASPASSQPIRPSPLRHSRQPSNLSTRSSQSQSHPADAGGERAGSVGSSDSRDGIQNPPTPGLFDVSLQSLHRFPQEDRSDDGSEDSGGSSGSGSSEEEVPATVGLNLNVSPPAYFPVDPNRYPAGVAEAMLSDVFSTPSSRLFAPANFATAGVAADPNSSGIESRGYEARNGEAGGDSGGWWSWLTGGSGSSTPTPTPAPTVNTGSRPTPGGGTR